jgi:plasmid stabilization system protein ParE
MKLLISRRADADLDSIWNYIAKDSLVAADRVETALLAAIDRLMETPNLGHFRDDVADRRYRFWREHSYLIVYRVMRKTFRVVRVVHGARDMSKMFPH